MMLRARRDPEGAKLAARCVNVDVHTLIHYVCDSVCLCVCRVGFHCHLYLPARRCVQGCVFRHHRVSGSQIHMI